MVEGAVFCLQTELQALRTEVRGCSAHAASFSAVCLWDDGPLCLGNSSMAALEEKSASVSM